MNLLENREEKKENKNTYQREKVGLIIELEELAKENSLFEIAKFIKIF